MMMIRANEWVVLVVWREKELEHIIHIEIIIIISIARIRHFGQTTTGSVAVAANINISPEKPRLLSLERRDVSNLVADGYKMYTNMRIDRHMHTQDAWWIEYVHSLALAHTASVLCMPCVYVYFSLSLCFSLCPVCRCGNRITIITLYPMISIWEHNVHCHYHLFWLFDAQQTGRTNNKKL